MSNVLVAVRVRPMNTREEEQGSKVAVKIESNCIQVTNYKVSNNYQEHDSRTRTRHFAFDFCYWTADKNDSNYASQEMIYQDLGVKVLDAVFTGFNACVLAYGQSGSGKTYTMMGNNGELGLVPRICQGLFEKMNKLKEKNLNFRTEISFLEIYNERVSDLLGPRCYSKRPIKQTLRVREHPKSGPCVQDLSKHVVNDYNAVQALLEKGIQNRNIAATRMHDHSSRSHAIFTITFTQARLDTELPSEIVSKIQLVDLAGSERAGINTSKIRLKEGANINKSLVALGSVICTLADRSMSQWNMNSSTSRGSSRRGSGVGGHFGGGGQPPFVPYRDSVLTWLLKDSLGGNSKTIMVATISPASSAFMETVNTLRYAQRAKCIVNKPIVNEDPKVKLIRELKLEVERLRQLLANAQKAIGNMLVTDMINRNQDKAEELTRIWIEKWNDFRQQEITCNSCANKLSNQNILSNYTGLNVREEHVQTVYNSNANPMFGRCIECHQSIKVDDETTPNSEVNLSSEKLNNECEGDEDEWSDADEFSYIDHKDTLNSLQHEKSLTNSTEKVRQLSPIEETNQTFSSISESFTSENDVTTIESDCLTKEKHLSTLDNQSLNLQKDQSTFLSENWSNFNISDRVFNYTSDSDSDIDRDSLDEASSTTEKDHANKFYTNSFEELGYPINNQYFNEPGQCQPQQLWSSVSCDQQKAQFASIQPQLMAIEATKCTSNSSLNMAIQQIVLKCDYCSPQLSNSDNNRSLWKESSESSGHSNSIKSTTSQNSDDEQFKQRRNRALTEGMRKPIRNKYRNYKRWMFEQRLQSIKRRKRKKTSIKIHDLTQSEETVNNLERNPKISPDCNISPPPLPLPSFLINQRENSETVAPDEQLNYNKVIDTSQTLADIDSNTDKQNYDIIKAPSSLTCWKEVVNNDPNRSSQPPFQFDCTSLINCQSWPSCDSLTMVYIGPKWSSGNENVINSIENLEDQLTMEDTNVVTDNHQQEMTNNCQQSRLDENLLYNNFLMNRYSESFNLHPVVEGQLSHNLYSCKGWSHTQLSGNWDELPKQASTQTDSGIQMESSFQPVNYCNWSYSTIDGHSQTRITTVDSGVQTDAIICHTTAQTEPTTNTVGQQTDPISNNIGVQIDKRDFCHSSHQTDHFPNKYINKYGVEDFNDSPSRTNDADCTVTCERFVKLPPDNKKKSAQKPSQFVSRDCNEGDETESQLPIYSSTVHDSCTPICESGIYIGFHGINKALRDIQVKVTLGDTDGKSKIISTNNTENDKSVFQEIEKSEDCLESSTTQDKCSETTLEPPEEFKEGLESKEIGLIQFDDILSKIQTKSKVASSCFEEKTLHENSIFHPLAVETDYKTAEPEISLAYVKQDHSNFIQLSPIIDKQSNHMVDTKFSQSLPKIPLNPSELFISVSDDEYNQLPLSFELQKTTGKCSSSKTISNNTPNKDICKIPKLTEVNCTCERWKFKQGTCTSLQNYREEEEEAISDNLPDDICQLLKECREVRKKAWQEITLAQQQLRFHADSALNELNICIIHGHLNACILNSHPTS